jgi:TerC family integral membrane protein
MLHISVWFWAAFIGFILTMLALDLGVFHRHAHEVRPKEAAIWTTVWVLLALAFAAGLALHFGRQTGLTFLTGYVIEESLSADNIFIIVLIFEYFRVPRNCQHRVLFYGIIGALIMRGIFIALGAALVSRFHWVLYIFGAMLIVTGVRMAFRGEESFDGEKNRLVRAVRRVIPLSHDFHGSSFFIVENGRRVATPLLLVLLLVELTDLLFAVDSIPATFGVTTDPFLVFTSNIFAVLGLRSLYFLLAAVVDRFYLLKYAIAAILAFVGVKMLGEPFFELGVHISLLVIVVVLGAAILGSVLWPQRRSIASRTSSRISK